MANGHEARKESDEVTDAAIRHAMLRLLRIRGVKKTICPSEVARHLATSNWRSLMDRIREQAAVLAESGHLYIEQGGMPVDPRTAKGPIRLRGRHGA